MWLHADATRGAFRMARRLEVLKRKRVMQQTGARHPSSTKKPISGGDGGGSNSTSLLLPSSLRLGRVAAAARTSGSVLSRREGLFRFCSLFQQVLSCEHQSPAGCVSVLLRVRHSPFCVLLGFRESPWSMSTLTLFLKHPVPDAAFNGTGSVHLGEGACLLGRLSSFSKANSTLQAP